MDLDKLWEILAPFAKYLLQPAIAVGVAVGIFRVLGKGWINSFFAKQRDAFLHTQSMQIQRLKIEIDSILNKSIKLQEKEFEVLSEAWKKLNKAYDYVSSLTYPLQHYADLQTMKPDEARSFLIGNEFTEFDIDNVLASTAKNDEYQHILTRKRIYKARQIFGDLREYVAANGPFITEELEGGFKQISDHLWSAIVTKDIGHGASNWNLQYEGWKTIQDTATPLYDQVKKDIRTRLRSYDKHLIITPVMQNGGGERALRESELP